MDIVVTYKFIDRDLARRFALHLIGYDIEFHYLKNETDNYEIIAVFDKYNHNMITPFSTLYDTITS